MKLTLTMNSFGCRIVYMVPDAVLSVQDQLIFYDVIESAGETPAVMKQPRRYPPNCNYIATSENETLGHLFFEKIKRVL